MKGRSPEMQHDFFSARIFFSSLVMETNSITLKVYRQIPTFAQEPRALSTCLGHGSSWFPQRFWVEFQRWAGGSTLGKSMNIFQGWFQFLWKKVIMMLAPPMQKILAIRRFAQDFIWPQDHKKQDLTPSSPSSSSSLITIGNPQSSHQPKCILSKRDFGWCFFLALWLVPKIRGCSPPTRSNLDNWANL